MKLVWLQRGKEWGQQQVSACCSFILSFILATFAFHCKHHKAKFASENIRHLPRSLPQQIGMFSIQQSAIHRGAAAKAFLRGAPRLMLAAVMFFQ